MNPSMHLAWSDGKSLVATKSSSAFTLTELLVVIGTLAVLALLLVPALAGTKTDTWRIQCQNNLKQLQVGFQLFAQDHSDMFPPAGWASGPASGPSSQITWDYWINRYIGGNLSDGTIQSGVVFVGQGNQALSIEVCPADTFPKVNWIGGTTPWFALRSYAMNAVGAGYGTGYQVNDQNRTYPLPDLTKPGMHGVGIYWTDTGSGAPDWSARGYKTSVMRDPAGTILLCENTHGQQVVANIWTCCCTGPQGTGDLYQIDPTTNPMQNPNSSTSVNQGILLYQAHQNTFNYAFHDGHVAAFSIQQTVGTGTLTAPQGMWTVIPGD